MSEPLAIEASGLSKTFGDKVAVRNLALEVRQGEVFGFLGPNGAGKTTSVKMLLGLITPTSGYGRILGAPLGDYQVRARVGFLPEHFRFHEWLTANEFLNLHADLYHLPREVSGRRIFELLKLVGLSPHAGKKLREFSKGMLQRIGLAQALLNEPDLVILDEPTSGLDPVGRRLVRDIIKDLRERGATVFLNSHLLSEVEITCDRVAFIKHGEVVQVSHMRDLIAGNLTVEVQVGSLPEPVKEGLRRWAEDLRVEDDRLYLSISRRADLPAIHRYLVDKDVEVYALHPREMSLEEIFISIIGLESEL